MVIRFMSVRNSMLRIFTVGVLICCVVLLIASNINKPLASKSMKGSSLRHQIPPMSIQQEGFEFVSVSRLLTDDTFVYYNPNGTYSPSIFVKYGHSLTGETFEADTAYITRALYTPIVIFGLGLLAIVGLYLGMISRCCSESCKCLPDPLSQKYDRNKTVNTVFFYLFSLLVLIFDQLVFIGNDSISSGTDSFQSALTSAKGIVNNLDEYSGDLVTEGDSLESEYTALQSSCVFASAADDDVSSYIDSFQSAASSLNSAISPIPAQLTDVDDYLEEYAVYYRNIALYVIWGLAIFISLLFIATRLCHSETGIKTSIAFGTIVYLLYLVLGIPWVLLTSIFGDLCMDPNFNIIKSLPASEDLRSIAVYYTTCVGNNTLQVYLDESVSGLTSLNDSIQALKTYCPNDANLVALQGTINEVGVTVDDISAQIACAPLQSIWNTVVLDSLCGDLYTGIFYIWGSQLVTSFCLFVLIWIAVFTYNYLDGNSNERVSPSEDDDDDDSEADMQMVDIHNK